MKSTPDLNALDRMAMTSNVKALVEQQQERITELEQRLAAGSSAYSELARRHEAGSASYAELLQRHQTATTAHEEATNKLQTELGQRHEAATTAHEKSIADFQTELSRRSDQTAAADAEVQRLRALFAKHGGEEIIAAGQVLETTRSELHALRAELDALNGEVRYIASGGINGDHPALDSIALQTEVRTLKSQLAEHVKSGEATIDVEPVDVDGRTLAQRRAISRQLSSLGLRAFNAEADSIIAAATARNEDASVEKLYRTADQIQKLLTAIGGGISSTYLEAKVRELALAVRHQEAKALERELEKERRAELREQARAERELEAERGRLEKERTHYENILEAMRAKGDDDGITRMEEKIAEVQHGIEDVDERAANIRAGYVYVISNVGAFGERMVKIGMTRRLDPMDRVRELGDASVPFGFDVHALFFSEDAVAVEAELHRRFAAQRVNRVNLRREFFHATPVEVRDVLKGITGDLIEFREDAAAEQYRESLDLARTGQLAAVGESTETIDDGLGEDDD